MLSVGETLDYFDGTHAMFLNKHYLGPITNDFEYRDFTIPYLNWTFLENEYNNSKYKIDPFLQLYEINSDPYETNNLAFKRKDIVNLMYNKLKNILISQNNRPDSAGVFYMFSKIMFFFKCILVSVIIIMVSIVWCMVRCCCRVFERIQRNETDVSKRKKNN